MKKIEISICLPVYNAEKYIKKTIKAVLNQTFENFELIIIDNKSTDKTIEIIENSFKDERIRLYKNDENIGMVRNWNKCLKKVRGEYIHFICSDDILNEECLEEKIKLIKKYDNIEMVVSNTEIINSNGTKIFTRKFCRKIKIIDGMKIVKKSFRSRNLFGEPSNIMFKKSSSDKIGMFNVKLSYTPDWEYWMRLAKFGKILYTDKVLTKFRVLPTSGTAYLLRKSNIMKEDDREFIKSIKLTYGKNINIIDICFHKLIGTIRLYAKLIFIKIFAINNKEGT